MIEVRLKQYLETHGRTRYWLAKESGIDYSTLARIERAELANRIELRVLDEICRALECQPGDLLVFIDEEKSAGTRAQKGTRKGK
jgi:putative transcriptional regulator